MTAGPSRTTRDDQESLRLLSLVERTLTHRLDEALRAHGADLDQWRVLSLLVERGCSPMHLVAEHALLLAPKASKLVDRMVSANLVLRRTDEQDRRRVLVAATARGRAALTAWDAVADAVLDRFRAVLGADADQLADLLHRLSRGLADR